MNEHPTPERLQEFVDGVLFPEERTRVEDHLATCAPCADEVRALRALLDRLEALPDTVEPERDHWPALRAEILAGEREPARVVPLPPKRDRVGFASPRIGWFGLAAAAVIALVFGLTRQPTRPPVDTPAVAETRSDTSGPMPVAVLAALESECTSATRELDALYVVRAGRLGPMSSGVDDGLRHIDQAILETRAALEESPGDPGLTLLLARRYEQKLELLRRMLRLAHTA